MSQFLATSEPKRIVCKTKEEWLLQRTGIGASEVAVILGESQWETPYQLWRRKKGIDAAKPANNLMIMGNLLEEAVSKYFELATGYQVIKASAGDIIYVHPVKDYLRVTPDRTYWIDPNGRKNESNKAILECKTSQRTIDPNDIPRQYFCQVQYQMGVMQKERATLAWISRGRDFGYAEISFDPDFFEYIVQEVDTFWNDYIIGDKVPDDVSSEDVLLRYPTIETGKTIEAGEHIIESYNRLREARENRLSFEKIENSLVEQLKVFCSDAEAITYMGRTIATWKYGKDSKQFDKTAFGTAYPDLLERFSKEVKGSRRFALK